MRPFLATACGALTAFAFLQAVLPAEDTTRKADVPTEQPKERITVPDELRQKYPELISLIEQSPTMSTDERKYWIGVIPIMKPDQIQNLRDILIREKKNPQAAERMSNEEQPKLAKEHGEELLNVPDELRRKHPELISLIEESKTINIDLRKQWLRTLPAMTAEQIQELRTILEKEKAEKDNSKFSDDVLTTFRLIKELDRYHDPAYKRASLTVRMNALLLPLLRWDDGKAPPAFTKGPFSPESFIRPGSSGQEVFHGIKEDLPTLDAMKKDGGPANAFSAAYYGRALFANVSADDFRKNAYSDKIMFLCHLFDGFRELERASGIQPHDSTFAIPDILRLAAITMADAFKNNPRDKPKIAQLRRGQDDRLCHLVHVYLAAQYTTKSTSVSLISLQECRSIYNAMMGLGDAEQDSLNSRYAQPYKDTLHDIARRREERLLSTRLERSRTEIVDLKLRKPEDIAFMDVLGAFEMGRRETIFISLWQEASRDANLAAAWNRLIANSLNGSDTDLGLPRKSLLRAQVQQFLDHGDYPGAYTSLGDCFSQFVFSLIDPPHFYLRATFRNQLDCFPDQTQFASTLRGQLCDLHTKTPSKEMRETVSSAIAFLENKRNSPPPSPSDWFGYFVQAIHQSDGRQSVDSFSKAARLAKSIPTKEVCLQMAFARAANPCADTRLCDDLLDTLIADYGSPWAY
jgi:hypothetical protein